MSETHEVVLRRRQTQAAKPSVLLLYLIAPLAFAVAHCIASRVLGQRTVVLSTLRSCSDTLVIPVVVSRFPSASCPGVFWHPCRTWFAAVVFFVTMPETCLSWCLSLDRKQELASNMSKTQLQIAQVIARALHGLSREQQLDLVEFPDVHIVVLTFNERCHPCNVVTTCFLHGCITVTVVALLCRLSILASGSALHANLCKLGDGGLLYQAVSTAWARHILRCLIGCLQQHGLLNAHFETWKHEPSAAWVAKSTIVEEERSGKHRQDDGNHGTR